MGTVTGAGRVRALLRFVLTATLLWAGLVKVLDPASFATAIEGYRLLPPGLVTATALALPWLELSLAFGLWIPALRRGSGWLTLSLLLGFTLLTLVSAARGLDIRCGCFGASASPQPLGWLLARNALLLAIGGWILRHDMGNGAKSREACQTKASA